MKNLFVFLLIIFSFIEYSISSKKTRKLLRLRPSVFKYSNDGHTRIEPTQYTPPYFQYNLKKYHEDKFKYKVIPDPKIRRPDSNESECDLQVELFPLYYTPILKSLSFRLAFASNCMSKRDLQFEVYFEGKHQVNYNFHPHSINLDIFDNHYTIEYGTPIPRDIFDIMRSLEYTTAKFLPIYHREEYDVKNKNDIYLFPQKNNTFTAYNIMKIQQTKLIQCEVKSKDDRKLNLSDYQVGISKNKVFGDDDDDQTKEEKVLNAEIEKNKRIQELKKNQFESAGIEQLTIYCKIK